MTELTDLGFSKKIIGETIISTYDDQRQPNAAPMGVRMEDFEHLILWIYTSSLTYQNLETKRCAVVNVLSDPELFYLTALKESKKNANLPQEWFERATIVDAPRLRKADAHIEVTAKKIRSLDDERAEVILQVKHINASKILPRVYCRASFATIEAIIHATRIYFLMKQAKIGEKKQALNLIERVRECYDVVNRVAPNSRYSKIMKELLQIIDLAEN